MSKTPADRKASAMVEALGLLWLKMGPHLLILGENPEPDTGVPGFTPSPYFYTREDLVAWIITNEKILREKFS